MNPRHTPVLDDRDAATVVADVTALQPAYTPDLPVVRTGPQWALAQVFGKYLQSVIERLNQAPDKNKLAFLDLLGVNLLPAQAARAPLVFTPIKGTGDGRVAERTRAGAKITGSSNPLVFETEQAIALAAAPLVEVVSVIPQRDTYASHSTALARGESFHLFQPERAVLHRVYYGHAANLALSGLATVTVQFSLSPAGNQKMAITWQYFNGGRWETLQTTDATNGLTRSGSVTLVSNSGTAAETVVNGVNTFWLRATLDDPLPPDAGRVFPLADSIKIACDIERPLRFDVIRVHQTPQGPVKEMGAVGDILPDQAYSEGAKLDVTKTFYPLGKSPDRNSALYFSNHEVFSKPGAKVTIAYRKVLTPEEQADILAAAEAVDTASQLILKAVKDIAKAGESCGSAVAKILVLAQEQDPTELLQALGAFQNAMNSASEVKDLPKIAQTANDLFDAMAQCQSDYDMDWTWFRDPVVAAAQAAQGLLTDLHNLAAGPITAANQHFIVSCAKNAAWVPFELARGLNNDSDQDDGFDVLYAAATAYQGVASAINDVGGIDTANQQLPPMIEAMSNCSSDDAVSVMALYTTATAAMQQAAAALGPLVALSQTPGVGTKDTGAPKLDPPRLVWEYCSETGWRALVGPEDDLGTNFQRSGQVKFTVPDDFIQSDVAGVTARWMRVRIDSGSYQILKIVTWKDPSSQSPSIMSILLQRPPALEGFYIGYHWKSPKDAPGHTFSYNDFQYEDHTDDAAGGGSPFAPYHPVADGTPTLYLGFDGALPADLLGLYFSIPEPQAEVPAVPVKWECFDGAAWSPITATDETTGLVLPGMVSAVWPGVPAPPSATVTQGTDRKATVTDPREAARFIPGQQLYISQNGAGELVTLQRVSHDTLTFTAALSRDYSNAHIQLSVMPRFGTPRSWIRVRMRQPGEPPHTLIKGLYSNAVWASQMQTNTNETLGSSNGEPDQAFTVRLSPVLEDEIIEVRELDGPAAAVQLPMLRDDLAKQGMSDADIRLVNDPRSGAITGVWVRWRVKPNLLFAGPESREVTIERTEGRLIFGDGVHGRIPPAGGDNILASEYRSGGGVIGNVPKGAISQLLSGVAAQSVTNPRHGEAGADGETIDQFLDRGPLVMRHRHQACAREDYEAMAQQASPGVAVARAYAATHSNGRPAPGWVSLVIVPQSQDAQPQPTFGLRQLVQNYITLRAPAALEGLAVVGPKYQEVGVSVNITPRDPANSGPVGQAVRDALTAFLHPLTGGPDGNGWPFGRSVYLSDIASLVEGIDGVDYAGSLDLLINNTPVGEVALIPENRIVAAGTIRVVLGGLEV